jgi:SAM-dependent methyltransferase
MIEAMNEPFDEEMYLQINPDVARAVELGMVPSGEAHYRAMGHAEGRRLTLREAPEVNFTLGNLDAVLAGIRERIAAYKLKGVNRLMHPEDDMMRPDVKDPQRAYFAAGEAAIQVITRSLILSRRTGVDSVLEIPSGAGRVTRHLRAFFPDARLCVSDVNKTAVEFAARTFSAEVFEASADFSQLPEQRFDLVFVGSLLTHLPVELFVAALNWLIEATATGGMLVITLHGRVFTMLGQLAITPEKWQEAVTNWQSAGYGHISTNEYETPYGITLSQPAWVLSQVQQDPRVRILTYEEGAWAVTQDVLVLSRV